MTMTGKKLNNKQKNNNNKKKKQINKEDHESKQKTGSSSQNAESIDGTERKKTNVNINNGFFQKRSIIMLSCTVGIVIVAVIFQRYISDKSTTNAEDYKNNQKKKNGDSSNNDVDGSIGLQQQQHSLPLYHELEELQRSCPACVLRRNSLDVGSYKVDSQRVQDQDPATTTTTTQDGDTTTNSTTNTTAAYLKARSSIPKSTSIVSIPRSYQFWITDAIRELDRRWYNHPDTDNAHDTTDDEEDDRSSSSSSILSQSITIHRHSSTNQPIDPRSYLAWYLTLSRIDRSVAKSDSNDDSDDDDPDRIHISDNTALLHQLMIENLPTHQDFVNQHHPMTTNPDELKSLLGEETFSFWYIMQQRYEWYSEYQTFKQHLPTTTTTNKRILSVITLQDYIASRLIVQTKACWVGSLENEPTNDVAMYFASLGLPVDTNHLQDHPMVGLIPLLSSIRREPKTRNANIRLVYDSSTTHNHNNNNNNNNIQLYTIKRIRPGDELIVVSESRHDIFASQGYVHGDFISDRVGTMLNSYHPMANPRVFSERAYLEKQQRAILTYLRFDDGYNECITNEYYGDSPAIELKRMKYQALLLAANRIDDWTVSFPPFDPDIRDVSTDGGIQRFLSTCRLLALTHRDYEGNATNKVIEMIAQMESSDYDYAMGRYHHGIGLLEKSTEGLEYRAMTWVWRLAEERRRKFNSTSSDELSKIRNLQPNSKEWFAAYVRYQELSSLEILTSMSSDAIQSVESQLQQREETNNRDYLVRQVHCPELSFEDLDPF